VGALNNRLENNISGMAVIKSFTAETFELDRVDQASKAYRDANYQAIGWSTAYTPVLRIFIALGLGGVLGLGSYWILRGDTSFTLGHLAFFAMMLQRLLWPITGLGRIFDDYERSMAAAQRIFQVLDSSSTISNPAAPAAPAKIEGAWTLKGVSFQYLHRAQQVLSHLDLNIPARHTIGIAGPTGAGKSTLIKLLLRLYDPTAGIITLDGVDLRHWDLQHLRRQIALVSQDTYLFHGTIEENIAYGISDAAHEAIVAAAQQAALHDFILKLPQGYQTIVGERGIKLSGGQRQRLSLARAILKNAPILILDEATSAVDTQTEQAIQDNLKTLCAGKTAIIIAHRLSTLLLADTIYVLDEGKVAEQGSHAALLAERGKYARLWELQTGQPG
jgi:ATP-binding cassette subfamily B protein